jgi:ribosomal protein L12E/L44/L45/RPP1/RPP2
VGGEGERDGDLGIGAAGDDAGEDDDDDDDEEEEDDDDDEEEFRAVSFWLFRFTQ